MITEYHTNDVILPLTGNVAQDQSMFAIRLAEPEAMIVMNRGPLQGKDLNEMVDNQIAKIKRALPSMVLKQKHSIEVGQDKHPAIEIESEYVQYDERFHQWQVILPLPQKNDVVVITYTKQRAFGDDDRLRWITLQAQLRIRNDQSN